jgi:hypothetical protein
MLLCGSALLLWMAGLGYGCGSSSESNIASDATSNSAGVRAVLAAALRHWATEAYSFGGHTVFTFINVVETLGAPMKNGMVDATARRAVSNEEKFAISEALKPASVQWVASTQAVLGSRPLLGLGYR